MSRWNTIQGPPLGPGRRPGSRPYRAAVRERLPLLVDEAHDAGELDRALREETYYLGLGLVALAEYRYCSPPEAPEGGADWADDSDWPGVQVELLLPANSLSHVPKSLEPSSVSPDIDVFGQRVKFCWGQIGERHGRLVRSRKKVVRRRTLKESEAVAVQEVLAAVDVLREVAGKRAARLAKREETIAHAHGLHGRVRAPAGLAELVRETEEAGGYDREEWTYEGYWAAVMGVRSAGEVTDEFDLSAASMVDLDEWLGTAEAAAWAEEGGEAPMPEEWAQYHGRALAELVEASCTEE